MRLKNRKTEQIKTVNINSFNGVDSDNYEGSLSSDTLSKGYNVWQDGGCLSVRPGFKAVSDILCYINSEKENLRHFKNDNFSQIRGVRYRLGALVFYDYAPYCIISPYAMNEKEIVSLPHFEMVSPMGEDYYMIYNVSFINAAPISGSGVIMVITYCRAGRSDSTEYIKYYELSEDMQSWLLLDPKSFYHPVCLVYGRGNKYLEALAAGVSFPEPLSAEQPNILNGAVRCGYICDGYSSSFKLPFKDIPSDDDVKAELYMGDGIYKTFLIPKSSSVSPEVNVAGSMVVAKVDRQAGTIEFTSNGTAFALPRFTIENGMRVTFYKYNKSEAIELFKSRYTDAAYGGRLFRASANSSRVYYSGKNNPLYFGSDSFIDVGQENEKLTVLSTQNRYLYMFKEQSIFRFSIKTNNAVNGDDIMEAVSKPVKTNLSYSLTLTHNQIGCDCPNSLCFCGNRLIWCHGGGAVYTLYGANNYSDGNIYRISAGIEKQLEGALAQKENIAAAYINTRYFLSKGQKVFVLDTLATGFSSMENKRTSAMKWFVWDTPRNNEVVGFCDCGEKMYVMLVGGNIKNVVYMAELSGESDVYHDGSDKTVNDDIFYNLKSAGIAPKERPFRLHSIRLCLENSQEAVFSTFGTGGTAHTLTANGDVHTVEYRPGANRLSLCGFNLSGSGKMQLHSVQFSFLKGE